MNTFKLCRGFQHTFRNVEFNVLRNLSFRKFSTESNGLRLILIGVPGSGKGTQSSKIEQDYGAIQISTGQILRQAVASKSEIGEKAKKQMADGGLVSDDIMSEIIESELSADKFKKKGWLLDGYPRTVGQANTLKKILQKIKQPLDYVFYLDVPDGVVIDRIGERLTHPGSGRVYNLSFNPPKVAGIDDITGEPLIKREDDNIETIKKKTKKLPRRN